MAEYIEQRDYITEIQERQDAYDQAMYELLERSADRACMAAENLAIAIDRLTAAITDQANARITDS
jgi:hypothetical protein